MIERRKYERFPLTIPARMEMMTTDRKQIFDLKTRDISASGAFIYTPEPFSEGTKFKIDLTVPSVRIKELTGAESFIMVEGKVVRSTPAGVAIHFDKECQIKSLKGL